MMAPSPNRPNIEPICLREYILRVYLLLLEFNVVYACYNIIQLTFYDRPYLKFIYSTSELEQFLETEHKFVHLLTQLLTYSITYYTAVQGSNYEKWTGVTPAPRHPSIRTLLLLACIYSTYVRFLIRELNYFTKIIKSLETTVISSVDEINIIMWLILY